MANSGSVDYFFIVSQLNGLVLDIRGGAVQGGSIQTFQKKKVENCDNQLWYLDENKFLQSKTGLVADLQGANPGIGANVIAWSKKWQRSQQWEVKDGRIKSRLNNLVLDIEGGSPAECSKIVLSSEKTSDNASQLWELVPEKGKGDKYSSVKMSSASSTDYFFIVSQLSGLVLEICGGAVQGGSIQTFQKNKVENCDNQLWCLDQNKHLQSKTGLVADIQGTNPGIGANVVAWPKKWHRSQQWEIKDGRIKSRLNNLVFDIEKESPSQCSKIILCSENTGDNTSQLWKFIPEKEMNDEHSYASQQFVQPSAPPQQYVQPSAPSKALEASEAYGEKYVEQQELPTNDGSYPVEAPPSYESIYPDSK